MNNSAAFEAQIARFTAKVDGRIEKLHLRCSELLNESVVEGSSITGAPGQPVQKGQLRGSFQLTFPKRLFSSLLTKLVYAPGIELGKDMRSGKTLSLRSAVGGFHSVKLTRAGWNKLVRMALKEID